MYAGAGERYTSNTSYYLYSGSEYWTMSPYFWDAYHAIVVYVNSDGNLYSNVIYNVSSSGGVRPVINLATTVTFNANSDGSSSNPYIVQ